MVAYCYDMPKMCTLDGWGSYDVKNKIITKYQEEEGFA